MNEVEQIEHDLNEQWNNYRAEPEVVYFGTPLGCVAISRGEWELETKDGWRSLTPEEQKTVAEYIGKITKA